MEKRLSHFIKEVFDQQFSDQFGPDAVSELIQEEIVLTKEQSGSLLAVLQALQTMTSIHVKSLVVSQEAQGRGLGSQLLEDLENEAKKRRVTSITLSTKSYQAKAFYIKNGYQIYATLEDVPRAGISKYHFIKRL